MPSWLRIPLLTLGAIVSASVGAIVAIFVAGILTDLIGGWRGFDAWMNSFMMDIVLGGLCGLLGFLRLVERPKKRAASAPDRQPDV